ncbi:MAG: PhoH family protein [Planctomycetes bacterium]|nr:PhoH family protein [Planctomycetota bacterium]MCB9919034.1 PhoH family protein [Planctomycetota bacterium]
MIGHVPGKIFVLDTNVILHDCRCLRTFEENDVVLPIVVLEELDRFKRGSEEIHFQARECLRDLDAMTGDFLATEGVSLGEGLGNLRVVVLRDAYDLLDGAFTENIADHRILATALWMKKTAPDRSVILVSKDSNLRVKAKSLGLVAQDYEADKVRRPDLLWPGRRIIEGLDPGVLEGFFEVPHKVSRAELTAVEDPQPNENFILRSGSKSVLAGYAPQEDAFVRIPPKLQAYGVRPRNAEQTFALRMLLDDSIRLVTLVGTAGTGKTLLALAAALECHTRYRQILLARPIVPLSNRDLGYLPGDVQSKIDPYMQPLRDNLAVIRGQLSPGEDQARTLAKLQESDRLVLTPLAYLRGRSLHGAFFIVDEAQNLTPHEVKTVLTRAGEGTKIVLTGDIRQIDQPYLDALSNGLSHVIARMHGQELYGHVLLEKGERSDLAELAGRLL